MYVLIRKLNFTIGETLMAAEELNIAKRLKCQGACRHGEDFRWNGAIGLGQREDTSVAVRLSGVDDVGRPQCGPRFVVLRR